MVDSGQLLHAYQQRHDEGAFSELVNRHIDLVYSTALRRTGGDAHLAQDIAQTVFTDLARKARRLPGNVVLGGWLYRHTCFTAAKALRSERRRQIREGEAVAMNAQNEPTDAIWRQIAPVLDEAMNGLNEDDRNAIVRRFFEQQPFREVGAALRTSEDAARMRVDRALEKLRKFLIRRGVTCSGAALSTVLAEELLTAAPAGLATNIAGAALAGTAAGTGTTVTFLKLMAMTKPKAGMVTAVVPAGLATSLVVQHRSLGRPRQENAELREQSKQLDQLRAENERLGKPRVDANELQGLRREHGELMRLRGEVASLRNENQRLASRQADNQRLPHQLSAAHSALDSEETPNEFLPADKWSDMGSATPETAARTWIWWRRNGNLERDQPLPGEDGRGREDAKSAPWNKEFKEVKGARLVSQEAEADGTTTVWIEYEMHSGAKERGAIRLRETGSEWVPVQVIGFPIRVWVEPTPNDTYYGQSDGDGTWPADRPPSSAVEEQRPLSGHPHSGVYPRPMGGRLTGQILHWRRRL